LQTKDNRRGNIAILVTLVGLGIVTLGIFAGKKLIDVGTRMLPKAEGPAVTSLLFLSEADSYVDFSAPGQNFGSSPTIRVNGISSQLREGFLRFNITGIEGTVTKAELKLTSDDNGTDKGPVVYAADNNWSEAGINYDNKPAKSGDAIADLGAININTTITIDVTSVISGNGLFSFTLVPTSTDGVRFFSKEAGSNRPILTITYETPTPTQELTESPSITAEEPVPPTVTQTPVITPTDVPTLTVTPTFTITPTKSPTPYVMCTPPACNTGEIYYCSGDCFGGCGTVCVTQPPENVPTATSTPSPTISPAACNQTCNYSVNPQIICQEGLICHNLDPSPLVGASGLCRNNECPLNEWCQCDLTQCVPKPTGCNIPEPIWVTPVPTLPVGCNPPPAGWCNELTITPTPIEIIDFHPGDANENGAVDGVDYVIWLNHYNQETVNGHKDGDFNGNGITDGLDYVIWLNNYGK